MSETMELSRDTLEAIGGYVKQNLTTWMREVAPPSQTDPVLLERIVRVEEELKAQRQLMKQGFEQTDKRFEQARSHTNHWMVFMTIVLLALGTFMSIGIFLVG